MENGFPLMPFDSRSIPPLTFAIQTGDGTISLLQITSLMATGEPPGVELRYKLLSKSKPSSGRTNPRLNSATNFGPANHDSYAQPRATLTAAFGPEKEVTLTEFNNGDGQEALDLDTSTVFKQPKDMDQWSEEGLVQWVKENGVDLFVNLGPGGVWGLMTTTDAELKLARVENDKWGAISEAELVRVLAGGPTALQIVTLGRMKVYVPPKGAQPPITFAFKTSSGGLGLLQITGYTDNPRGVKIRYKLVKEP